MTRRVPGAESHLGREARMRSKRGWLGRGLLLLAVAGCSHSSSVESQRSPESWAVEDWGTRTKGVDSATLRIQTLIAQGELHEAEALLAQAIAAGLIARKAATQLQEKIAERKQQSPDPDRRVPPSNLEDLEIEDTQHSCATEMPEHPVCRELPQEYSFHSARQALEAMKQRLDEKTLALHKPERTTEGPCPGLGQHYNVRLNGARAGSITCCPCCVENMDRPLEWTKCRIVW
jgi:hypothetical protein